jgi:ferredoxin
LSVERPTAVRVRVRFEPSGLELEVPAGERLLDVADEHLELGLPAACRAGNCGVCLLRVRAGANALLAPAHVEQQALAALRSAPAQRLGCQVCIRPDLGPDQGPVILVLGPA